MGGDWSVVLQLGAIELVWVATIDALSAAIVGFPHRKICPLFGGLTSSEGMIKRAPCVESWVLESGTPSTIA